MSKKPLIIFEGVEGSGKTYHLDKVAKFLKKKNLPFIKIREPGGNRNSEKIRNLILNSKTSFNKKTDLLLYQAARSENINNIKKNYKKKIILVDRFTDSTIAYQHFGFGLNLKMIKNLNKYLLGNIRPSFTFLNIVNKKNMLIRLKIRKKLNRYDKFTANFYNKVQNGFLKLARNKKNYKIINSNLDIIENENEILSIMNRLIK